MPSRTAIVIGTDTQINAMCCAITEPRSWTIYSAADARTPFALYKRTGAISSSHMKRPRAGKTSNYCAQLGAYTPAHESLYSLTGLPQPMSLPQYGGMPSAISPKPFSLDSLTAMLQYAILEPFWDDGIEVVSARPGWICLLVRCDIHTADRLMHFFDEIVDLPTAEKEVVATAFRELLTNAIEHGGKLNPEQRVEISYLRTNRAVACKITDPGPGFSPDNIPHAATMNPPDNPLRHLAFRNAKNLRLTDDVLPAKFQPATTANGTGDRS